MYVEGAVSNAQSTSGEGVQGQGGNKNFGHRKHSIAVDTLGQHFLLLNAIEFTPFKRFQMLHPITSSDLNCRASWSVSSQNVVLIDPTSGNRNDKILLLLITHTHTYSCTHTAQNDGTLNNKTRLNFTFGKEERINTYKSLINRIFEYKTKVVKFLNY